MVVFKIFPVVEGKSCAMVLKYSLRKVVSTTPMPRTKDAISQSASISIFRGWILKSLTCGVIGNTTEFESVIISSNLNRSTIRRIVIIKIIRCLSALI